MACFAKCVFMWAMQSHKFLVGRKEGMHSRAGREGKGRVGAKAGKGKGKVQVAVGSWDKEGWCCCRSVCCYKEGRHGHRYTAWAWQASPRMIHELSAEVGPVKVGPCLSPYTLIIRDIDDERWGGVGWCASSPGQAWVERIEGEFEQEESCGAKGQRHRRKAWLATVMSLAPVTVTEMFLSFVGRWGKGYVSSPLSNTKNKRNRYRMSRQKFI